MYRVGDRVHPYANMGQTGTVVGMYEQKSQQWMIGGATATSAAIAYATVGAPVAGQIVRYGLQAMGRQRSSSTRRHGIPMLGSSMPT